jgi:hypothetical protein
MHVLFVQITYPLPSATTNSHVSNGNTPPPPTMKYHMQSKAKQSNRMTLSRMNGFGTAPLTTTRNLSHLYMMTNLV